MSKVLDIFDAIFPSIANARDNKKVRQKISCKKDLDSPSKAVPLDSLTEEDLKSRFDQGIKAKEKLEDKGKTNVIGVTIAVTLSMGAYTLVQNISSKYGNGVAFWAALIFFILSVLYMIIASIHAIHMITAENVVHYPDASKNSNEYKKDLDLQIGLNRANNIIRNNYLFTSYQCIRNSLVCLFIVTIIAILPIKAQSQDSYCHGNYYFSEQAMESISGGIKTSTVRNYIDANLKNGNYSVVDQKDGLYIKYSVYNGKVIVSLIEAIDN